MPQGSKAVAIAPSPLPEPGYRRAMPALYVWIEAILLCERGGHPG
ncbi:hypothetical protein BJ928_103205 [Rhizobium sp. WW_1]|jgi:hypothetical protein|nr:hypothetical protein BJ928_103205 [Rhizobium sp. WW_1]